MIQVPLLAHLVPRTARLTVLTVLQGSSGCRPATRNWCTRTWRPWSTRRARPGRNNRRPCFSGWASWAGSSRRRPDSSRSYCPCPTRRPRTRRPPISAANRRGSSPKFKIPKRATLRPTLRLGQSFVHAYVLALVLRSQIIRVQPNYFESKSNPIHVRQKKNKYGFFSFVLSLLEFECHTLIKKMK